MSTLISTLPQNEHEAAAIKRSRQLTDFCWTPIRDIPTYTRQKGHTVLPAGKPIVGFLYGSEEENDKFFCENVSFESFLTAVSNPYSKLYSAGHGALNAPNYGIVCNGLARYAFGIPYRVSTARWLTIPGMNLVKPCGEYTADEIKLCDVLYSFGKGENHVALVTDILRDENGEVAQIEVSEAVRPVCKRDQYTLDRFFQEFDIYDLLRYDGLGDVPLFDGKTDDLLWNSRLDKTPSAITVDNGNRSNYLEGEETVISAVVDGEDEIEIYKDGELEKTVKIYERAVFPKSFSRGHYTLRLKKNGETAEFCVNFANIRHTLNGDGTVTVYAESYGKESSIAYLDFRQEGIGIAPLAKYEELTEEEKQSGIITRNIPDDGKNYKVYFKNEYGIWTYPMRPLFL